MHINVHQRQHDCCFSCWAMPVFGERKKRARKITRGLSRRSPPEPAEPWPSPRMPQKTRPRPGPKNICFLKTQKPVKLSVFGEFWLRPKCQDKPPKSQNLLFKQGWRARGSHPPTGGFSFFRAFLFVSWRTVNPLLCLKLKNDSQIYNTLSANRSRKPPRLFCVLLMRGS